MLKPLRIALVASARYPIRQPFAGGLEAHTAQLATGLRAIGHHVSLFGGADSDPGFAVHEFDPLPPISDAARHDVSMPADWFLAEHHAYLGLMLRLARDRDRFDLVHNNSLHYLPLAMADTLPVPVLTTLHTPPTPWLESAIRLRPAATSYAAVSRHTARQWAPLVPARVVSNGVDTDFWRPGPGGGTPVWFGRLVPEKGPAEAIEAARLAGTGLRLAGPVPDRAFFRDRIEPCLNEHITYLGHLDHVRLARLVGSASAAVVSPCWDEPYGLVVAEALACGTPVAGFARGALPELLDDSCGALAPAGDVEALARAIPVAARLSRTDARRHAERTCSLQSMITGYDRLYRDLVPA